MKYYLPVAIAAAGLVFVWLPPSPLPPKLLVLDPSDWVCTQPTQMLDQYGRVVCNQFTGKGVKP